MFDCLKPVCARWAKLVAIEGPMELFIVLLGVYIIGVMIKHLIGHTGYFYWHRSGRRHVTSCINNVKGDTSTGRIVRYLLSTRASTKKVPSSSLHSSLQSFTAQHYYEFFPSLLDQRKTEAFHKQVDGCHKFLLFLPDNGGQELLSLLHALETDTTRAPSTVKIFVVLDSASNPAKLQVSLQNLLEATKLPASVDKIKFLPASLPLEGTFDLIYFGHNTDSYMHTLRQVEPFMLPEHTKLVANHAIQGGEGITDFLMHVRRRPKRYATTMYPGNYETTWTYEKKLLDGLEVVTLAKQ